MRPGVASSSISGTSTPRLDPAVPSRPCCRATPGAVKGAHILVMGGDRLRSAVAVVVSYGTSVPHPAPHSGRRGRGLDRRNHIGPLPRHTARHSDAGRRDHQLRRNGGQVADRIQAALRLNKAVGPLAVFTASDLGTGDSYRRQSGWAGKATELDARIEARFRQHRDAEVILTLPGMGPTTKVAQDSSLLSGKNVRAVTRAAVNGAGCYCVYVSDSKIDLADAVITATISNSRGMITHRRPARLLRRRHRRHHRRDQQHPRRPCGPALHRRRALAVPARTRHSGASMPQRAGGAAHAFSPGTSPSA